MIRKAAGGNATVQGELHPDFYLSNFSQKYTQDDMNFVAGIASTSVPVNLQGSVYLAYQKGQLWRDTVEPRPMGGRPPQVSYKVDKKPYFTEELALESVIDDRIRVNTVLPLNLDENATEQLTIAQMIHADVMWTERCFKAGVWGHDFIGGVDFTPFTDHNSDVFVFIENKCKLMQRTTGRRPNKMVVGANVDTYVSNHPGVLDRIKYTQRGITTPDLLASMFHVEEYRVAGAIMENAPETADGSLTDIDWIQNPDSFWLGYINPVAALNSITAISMFDWVGLIPGGQPGGVISRGREPRAYSDFFHSRKAYDIQVVAPDLGMFFASAVIPPSGELVG